MATKFVHYHQEFRAPKKFAVLKDHKDGTIDIGPEDGEPVVTRCVIVAEAKPGFATVEEVKAPAEIPLASKKLDELREIALGLKIDVSGLKKKEEFVQAIEAAQQPK